jgi:hypothetical protein
MEILISVVVLLVITGVACFFIVLNKKKRNEVKTKVEDLEKMTKAKLGEFAKEHKLSVDLKKKKAEIIKEIKSLI